MKQISFTQVERPAPPTLTRVQNNAQYLIEQIVQQCSLTDKEKKDLAKRLAIAMHTAGWTEQDLHALLKKKEDKGIRNFTGFVKWSATIRNVNN